MLCMMNMGTVSQVQWNGASKELAIRTFNYLSHSTYKKNSSGVTFMYSSVRKVVVGNREVKGQLERIRLRGENIIKMNVTYCK